jgi:hypothetical protein
MDWNVKVYNALETVLSLFARLGLPLSIFAWMSVLCAAIAMGLVLKKSAMRRVWGPALAVGCLSLAAHLLDYYVTLQMSPDLVEESNPIWRNVIDHLGITVAKFYGFTGKILLSILSFEFYAYYLIQRERLFPKSADNFFGFWEEFGKGKRSRSILRWCNMVNLFSFTFALIGFFSFYVAFMNSLVDHSLYLRLPSIPLMLLLYIAALVITYLVMTYRAFLKS